MGVLPPRIHSMRSPAETDLPFRTSETSTGSINFSAAAAVRAPAIALAGAGATGGAWGANGGRSDSEPQAASQEALKTIRSELCHVAFMTGSKAVSIGSLLSVARNAIGGG